MCQIAVYLDDEKIMESVMLVEPIPEGVRLTTMFETPQVTPATIQQIDLMKNRIFLEKIEKDSTKE